MDRLVRKFETARKRLPKPVIDEAGLPRGVIAYGSSHWAVVEARDELAQAGAPVDYCRLRALPVCDEVISFIERHERVYVVEQNRDGQVCGLLRSQLEGVLADRLISVRHYDGQPIPASAISQPILTHEKPGSAALEASTATDNGDGDELGATSSE
jgi:2-oxoglutarate ferredoxin oxidoreductase subunit alpha